MKKLILLIIMTTTLVACSNSETSNEVKNVNNETEQNTEAIEDTNTEEKIDFSNTEEIISLKDLLEEREEMIHSVTVPTAESFQSMSWHDREHVTIFRLDGIHNDDCCDEPTDFVFLEIREDQNRDIDSLTTLDTLNGIEIKADYGHVDQLVWKENGYQFWLDSRNNRDADELLEALAPHFTNTEENIKYYESLTQLNLDIDDIIIPNWDNVHDLYLQKLIDKREEYADTNRRTFELELEQISFRHMILEETQDSTTITFAYDYEHKRIYENGDEEDIDNSIFWRISNDKSTFEDKEWEEIVTDSGKTIFRELRSVTGSPALLWEANDLIYSAGYFAADNDIYFVDLAEVLMDSTFDFGEIVIDEESWGSSYSYKNPTPIFWCGYFYLSIRNNSCYYPGNIRHTSGCHRHLPQGFLLQF